MVGSQAHQLFVTRIGNANAQVNAARHHHQLGGVNARLRCLGVSTHQAARAQQHTAEIARHHARDVGQPRMLQHLKRRQARRFLRFAVVGVAHAARRARTTFAQDVRVHVVPRHAVRRANLFQKRQRFLFGFHMRQAGDEAAFLLLDFRDRATFDGGI